MKQRSKNKWNSQRISKRFKNRHLNDENRDKCMVPKYNANLYIKNCQHDAIFYDTNVHDVIPSWSCKRCTFYNTENNSYCTICEFPFNPNTNTDTTTCNNGNENQIVLGDYLQPILNQIESNQDDFDEQIQFAIALSLQNPTNSDDSDNTASTLTCTSNNSNTSIINTKKRKTKQHSISFASYWHEMREYNAMFEKNLKYIMKQNKLRMNDGMNTTWANHGKMSAAAYDVIKRHTGLMDAVPSIDKIYEWLGVRWNVHDFSIENIINCMVLEKFIAHGGVKHGHLRIVYHGTRSCNEHSIIEKGLLVGGTKGVPVANGSVYGRGIYCSPSLSTASSYQRGSLFICLVRSHRCNRHYNNIYVVPNDNDILPIYVARFAYPGGSIVNNTIFKFQPGWTPLNIKATKERKVRRKWSAYHKLTFTTKNKSIF